MKRVILAFATLAIAGASVQTAWAGGSKWCVAGQVLAGVTAGIVIGQAVACQPARYVAPAPVCYPAPVYSYPYYCAPPAPPPVVYAAPVRVVYAAPAPAVVYRRAVYVVPAAVRVGFDHYGGCGPHGARGGCR